jgi:hypothetical protein
LNCNSKILPLENVENVESLKHGCLSFPAQVQGPFVAIGAGDSYYRSLGGPTFPFGAKDENEG